MLHFRVYLALSLLLALDFTAQGQNQAPNISNFTANINWNSSVLTLDYSVSDPENDPLEVLVYFSKDGGKTYDLGGLVGCSGDIDYPVIPGAGKKITCATNQLINVAPEFRVRLVADDLQSVDIQALVNQVDSNRLRSDLKFVQGIRHRTAGLAHLNAVRDSMQHLLQDAEYFTDDQTFAYTGGYTAHNLVGNAVGVAKPDSIVIVDAHYDSVSNGPGADDNGSGVVGVWEIARLLSAYPSRKTMRFIGFDLEEAGVLGSISYVTNKIPATEKIKGVFNFEMIGYYSQKNNSQTLPTGFNLLFPDAYNAVAAQQFKGNFITNVGNVDGKPLTDIFAGAAAQYVPDLRVITVNVPGTGSIAQDLRRSDHAPFWDGGYQALMLTDGANFRNANYHKPGDTLGALNFTFMSNVVKATLAAVAQASELLHGDQAFADFAGTVSTQAPLNCALQAFVIPGDREHIQLKVQDCAVSSLQYSVLDAKGAQLCQGNLRVTANELQVITTPSLKPGLYFLQLRQQNGVNIVKLAVE
jgi:hypothetical protein